MVYFLIDNHAQFVAKRFKQQDMREEMMSEI